MKSEEDRPVAKISYEKPTALDLGPAAPVVGASCATGQYFGEFGVCELTGNAAGLCTHGNSAGTDCNTGTAAD